MHQFAPLPNSWLKCCCGVFHFALVETARLPCPFVLAGNFRLQQQPKNPYKPSSNGVCHTYNLPQNRAGIFLAKCLCISFGPPAVPSLLLSAAFSPSGFPCVYSGMFQGSVIIPKESTVRAQATEWFFFWLLLLGQIKPIFHLDTEM